MPTRHVRSRGQATAITTNGKGRHVAGPALLPPSAAEPASTERQPSDAQSAHRGLDLLLRTLGGIAGGVGVLGFVVLVGGTIAFARLSAAGLPADEAVGDIPRDALLVIGAKALLPFAVGVLLGSTVLYAIDKRVQDTERSLVRISIAGGVALTGTVLHVALVLFTKAAPPWWTYALLFGLGMALVLLVVLVVGRGDVLWFVLAGVLAAGLFSETSVLIRTFALPTVRPVALELNDGSAIAGIYVAQTSTQLLVGEVCTDPHDQNVGAAGTGFMRVIPREQVKAMTIGVNGSLAAGIQREAQLAEALPGAPRLTPVAGVSAGQRCTSATAVPRANR